MKTKNLSFFINFKLLVKTEIKLLIRNQKPREDFKIISINYQPLEIMFFLLSKFQIQMERNS
jgi:hypothetical protein